MVVRRPVRMYSNQTDSQGCGLSMGRILIVLVIAGIALFSFLASKQFNPVTGQDQYVSLTPNQEIALGLQAAPEMIQEYGGEDPDPSTQALVDEIGGQLAPPKRCRRI